MTLNTAVYILDPIDPLEVQSFFNKHLLKVTDPIIEHKPATNWNRETRTWDEDPEVMDLDNQVGQGFDAWYMSQYRKGGLPLHAEDVYSEVDEDYPDEEPYVESRKCFMKVNFDTAYGYISPKGGCAELHTYYIVALHDWLATKGVRIQWVNEFSGEIFDGLNGLDDFSKAGDDARKWFKSIMPGVMASIAAEYSEGKEKQS